MEEMYIPDWFFLKIPEEDIKTFEILSIKKDGVIVKVTVETAAKWRRALRQHG